MAGAINDPVADLDKDGQVSLLEAFLTAASRVREFYRAEARLATEHPLIDDTGDKLGSPADWFRGVRATTRAKDGAAADGLRAHQWHLVPSDRERALPADLRNAMLPDLPANITLEPGRLEIRVETAEAMLESLVALAMIMTNDLERFRALVESADRTSSQGRPEATHLSSAL